MEVGTRDKQTLLVVTDRVGSDLTNGAQVFADAVVRQLAQWFDVEIFVAKMEKPVAGASVHELEDRDILSGRLPDLSRVPGVIYNLGGTFFSCRVAKLATRAWPHAHLANHFQLNLAAYAKWEQVAASRVHELALYQPQLAAVAAVNLFPSFSELALASQNWELTQSLNYVLPNPFVPAESRGVGEEEREKEKEKEKEGPFTFLAAGRFSDFVKGADILYRAFTQVHVSFPLARLEVAADGERFREILRGLPTDVWSMHPWMARDQLHALMRKADVVVVPSRYEPFGLVALEAMRMGTPVIAMAVGGLREIVHDKVTGWLCSPPDGSFDLAAKMRAAIAAGRPVVRAMGEAAARVAERDYALEGITDRIRLILDNLPQRRGTARARAVAGTGAASRRGGLA